MSKTILVVDDEKDIVEMLKYNLRKEGFRVLTASDGLEAIRLAISERPDAILLDIMMPGMDGLAVVRQLKADQESASIPVLFLTAKGADTDEIVGLELGAEDYIVKPISIGKLLARLRATLRRSEQVTRSDAHPSSNLLVMGDMEINVPNYTVKVCGVEIPFARKEFEVLLYLARHPEQVISRERLLNAIWGTEVYVGDRTVDVHVRKIREKLGNCASYIETVKGVGYRFRV